ncbi:MAG: hypothetical protein LBV38_06570 [Alistipes sp.]|jgi:hypothetical protein|nr:hypothetical protein [Alistipes sp.]
MAAASTFKIKKAVNDIEELAELLRKHLDPKFKISVTKAGSGLKQFVTGTTGDTLNINKNAYHGVILTLSDPMAELDYQVIGAWMCVPNPVLKQFVGHDGVLDKLICNLIFSNGKDLYDSVQETIIAQLDGKRVDVGMISHAKAALKGKTLWDDESTEKKA